ncbi:MAG: SDR family oxidoreductase [Phycisphaeraceae bacterium]|nr:SDR family oxidoreductase [Phycisphaeraceae bacterium]
MPDKTVLVTGAGSGIGLATAKLLAQSGYAVALVGRTVSKLETVAATITSPTLVLPADVTDPADCHHVVDQVMRRWGRLDALANVAGDAPNLPLDKVTPDVWRRCIETNLGAVVHLTAAAWPCFRQRKAGVVVNVSSMASISPFPGFAIYAAAKAGLNMYTRCAATEGMAFGVKTVAIAPGAVETPMLRGIFSETAVPKDRALSPYAVAQVIVDCITGDRDFASGETITVPSP